jgi:DNA end-binding protein Ku
MYFNKSYYLEPDGAGAKPYVLLRQALEESGRVALVKLALRQRESLAALRVRDGVFVLEMMLWPDEIRTPDFGFLDDDIEVRSQELKMAQSLIETLSGDFAPTEYADDYREALEKLIEAKVEGREVVQPNAGPSDDAPVVDLMAALRASVAAARESRGEGSDSDSAEGSAKKKGSARRSSAAAAKKTSAKRTRTKKSA